MTQLEVMLHPQVHTSKPTNYGGYKYFNALTTKNVTLTELAEHVSKGKIFFPSVHFRTETVSASTYAHQQLCLVDVDNCTENPYSFSEESIMALAKPFGIDVALIYRTQSYTLEVPKFRVGFITDRTFTEYEGLLEEAHSALYKIINSVSTERLVDTSCNEPSRLFNGALYDSKPYVNEDAAPFNAEALIELTKDLPEVPEKKENAKNNGNKIQKGESGNSTASIEAIKERNVHAFRTSFLENLQRVGANNGSHFSHFAYKALTENAATVMTELDMETACELFNHLPMAELFSLPNVKSFVCVVHEDSRPSASIFSDDIDMYKCFSSNCSCEKAHTNFMLLTHFIGGKKKAFKFINTLFNIEVINVLTERVSQNKAFIESNLFKDACPVTYRLVSAYSFKRKLFETLETVASVVMPVQLTKDENDCSFFYSMNEMEKLMEGTIACTSPDAGSQMMAFAALLGLVNKRSDEELTEETTNAMQEQRLRTAERTNQEASNVRRLSVYNIPLLSEVNLGQLETIAVKVKNGGISASKMSRNLVAQAFGEDVATLVYPTEKATTISFKKHSDVIRVKKAIQICLQKHSVADKNTVQEILGSTMNEFSRRDFDNTYSIALAELGLQTEVVTNLHRELFNIDFPRNTRISFYPDVLEETLVVEEEIIVEELPVAAGAEMTTFMQTIIASLNEEEHQGDVTSISHVEVGDIPVVSVVEPKCSLKTESDRKAVIKLNTIKAIPVDNENMVEVFNERNQLIDYQTLAIIKKRPTQNKSRVTRSSQSSYVGIKRCKKRAPTGRWMLNSRCKPNNNWKVYTLDNSSIAYMLQHHQRKRFEVKYSSNLIMNKIFHKHVI